MLDMSDGEIRDELTHATSVLRDVTGVAPRKLFRFPYGERDARTNQIVADLGYTSVYWTVDTMGWLGKGNGERSVSTVVERVLGALSSGEIVLMHAGSANDGSTLDADALEAVITAVEKRGYRFVSLAAYVG
jgi:peptidoglycan/xylan/chitin deacetylase (PgdA/CDA1 family)